MIPEIDTAAIDISRQFANPPKPCTWKPCVLEGEDGPTHQPIETIPSLHFGRVKQWDRLDIWGLPSFGFNCEFLLRGVQVWVVLSI